MDKRIIKGMEQYARDKGLKSHKKKAFVHAVSKDLDKTIKTLKKQATNIRAHNIPQAQAIDTIIEEQSEPDYDDYAEESELDRLALRIYHQYGDEDEHEEIPEEELERIA